MEKRNKIFPHLYVKNENAVITECKLAKQTVDENVIQILKDLKTLKRLSSAVQLGSKSLFIGHICTGLICFMFTVLSFFITTDSFHLKSLLVLLITFNINNYISHLTLIEMT